MGFVEGLGGCFGLVIVFDSFNILLWDVGSGCGHGEVFVFLRVEGRGAKLGSLRSSRAYIILTSGWDFGHNYRIGEVQNMVKLLRLE